MERKLDDPKTIEAKIEELYEQRLIGIFTRNRLKKLVNRPGRIKTEAVMKIINLCLQQAKDDVNNRVSSLVQEVIGFYQIESLLKFSLAPETLSIEEILDILGKYITVVTTELTNQPVSVVLDPLLCELVLDLVKNEIDESEPAIKFQCMYLPRDTKISLEKIDELKLISGKLGILIFENSKEFIKKSKKSLVIVGADDSEESKKQIFDLIKSGVSVINMGRIKLTGVDKMDLENAIRISPAMEDSLVFLFGGMPVTKSGGDIIMKQLNDPIALKIDAMLRHFKDSL
jgi:hypothetical protein